MVNEIYWWLKLTECKNFGAISELNFQNRPNTTIPEQSCGLVFHQPWLIYLQSIFVEGNISGATTMNESKTVENYSNIHSLAILQVKLKDFLQPVWMHLRPTFAVYKFWSRLKYNRSGTFLQVKLQNFLQTRSLSLKQKFSQIKPFWCNHQRLILKNFSNHGEQWSTL